MNKHTLAILITLLLCCLIMAAVALAAPAVTTVGRWVMGGGGGYAAAAPYSLESTIGQPVVGVTDQDSYQLSAGYWAGLRAAAHNIYLPMVLRQF